MSSLFRGIHNFADKRETAIKEALMNTLLENVRGIEFEVKQSGRDYLEFCESTSCLCSTLEAVFLHGLKDSFLWATLNVIAADAERRPDPSFWPPLMVFLHKQVMEQINDLSQINTETGQCRAWIRMTLNEAMLSAYLVNIKKNSSALNPYYKKYALLKDSENLKKTIQLVQELESMVQLNLPYNSSLLNHWPDNSLFLSGLWSPAMKTCPITSGVDIAGTMCVETEAIPTPQPLRTNELFSESISNSPFRNTNFGIPDLSQRENFDIFYQQIDLMKISAIEDGQDLAEALNEENLEKAEEIQEASTSLKEFKDKSISTEGLDFGTTCGVGNSLTNLMQKSWSSDLNNHLGSPQGEQASSTSMQRSMSMNSNCSIRSLHSDRCSYNDLLKKHRTTYPVDLQEIWGRFVSVNSIDTVQEMTPAAEKAEDEQSIDSKCNDYEVVSADLTEKFQLSELKEMVAQLCEISRELGLDAQGLQCKSCQVPLAFGAASYNVCAFSGDYFCDLCMDVEPVPIPARIIYNWDFRKYPISKKAALFLSEFRNQPFIDLKVLNPDIYKVSDAMAELQSLRIRLNFIRAYLLTCCPASYEILQKEFFGKEYLFENIHQYSICDLNMIQRGTLNQQLQKAFKLGETHILACPKCSLKGFLCEICKSSRILYPFHIETTFRCEQCGAVFHATCLNDKQPCPRCVRKKKREDSILLEVDENLIEE